MPSPTPTPSASCRRCRWPRRGPRRLAGRTLDRYDTQDNITGGVLIIRALQASADSREQAIAGYYQGLYSVRTKGMYEDTKKYVATVLAVYDRL